MFKPIITQINEIVNTLIEIFTYEGLNKLKGYDKIIIMYRRLVICMI